jgi:hypothetical protein
MEIENPQMAGKLINDAHASCPDCIGNVPQYWCDAHQFELAKKMDPDFIAIGKSVYNGIKTYQAALLKAMDNRIIFAQEHDYPSDYIDGLYVARGIIDQYLTKPGN